MPFREAFEAAHLRDSRLCRDKLPQFNTVEDVVHLLRKSRKIMVLTGAGISVSCGIRAFRVQLFRVKWPVYLDCPVQSGFPFPNRTVR